MPIMCEFSRSYLFLNSCLILMGYSYAPTILQQCRTCSLKSACRGSPIPSTLSACTALLNGASGTVVEYDTSTNMCTQGSCNALDIPSPAQTTVSVYRYTGNTDCPSFSIIQHPIKQLSGGDLSNKNMSFSDCIDWCLDTELCYTFRYKISKLDCWLHTECGTNCIMADSGDLTQTVYVKSCGCPILIDPSNGFVNSTSTTTNATATYGCDTGYSMSTSGSRTCQENGTWSSTEPTCNVTDCSAPSTPSNGSVSYNATTYGSNATYTCDTGYNPPSSTIRTCQSNGQWSGVDPTCSIVDCSAPSTPSNGSVAYSATTYSSNATYTCDTGYNPASSTTRTCQSSGQWSGVDPTCSIVDCSAPSTPSNGSVANSATTYGSNATYTCDTGYNPPSSTTRTCQSNGQWSGVDPTCSIVDCNAPSTPSNGSVAYSATTYGSNATYTCDTGYNPPSSTTRTCQSNGQWSGVDPTCSIVDCNAPLTPSNGSVAYSATTYGSNATYTCDTGYNPPSSTTRTCQSNGQWSGVDPICSSVACISPTTPINGSVVYNSTVYDSVAIYSCDVGFNLTTGSTRECLSTGSWSGENPACTIIDCGLLSPPSSGAVHSADGTTYNHTATYSCSSGYSISGTSARVCQSSGLWSGTEPTCTPDAVSTPIAPAAPAPPYIMPCICYNKTFTNLTQEQIIDKLIAETRINTRNTSAARRKNECASDPRPSAAAIGNTVIGILSLLCMLIVVLDICPSRRRRKPK